MDLNSACQRWYNAGIDHYIWEFPGNMESFSFWLPHPARASLAELHTDSTDCLTRLQCIMVWFERICDFWYLGAATLIAQAGLFKEMAGHTDRASNSTAGVVFNHYPTWIPFKNYKNQHENGTQKGLEVGRWLSIVFVDFWLEHTFLGVLQVCSFKATQLDLRHESWRTCWVWLLILEWYSFNVQAVWILDHKFFNVLKVFPERMWKLLDGCSEFPWQLDATWRNQGLEDVINGLQPFFEDDVATPSTPEFGRPNLSERTGLIRLILLEYYGDSRRFLGWGTKYLNNADSDKVLYKPIFKIQVPPSISAALFALFWWALILSQTSGSQFCIFFGCLN